MKKLSFTIFLAATALQYSGAAEVATTPATAAPADSTAAAPEGGSEAANQVAALELKNKSSFTMQDNGRNPFWPIGWKPAPKQSTNPNATEVAGPEVQSSAFVVSSIVMDPRARFAIINGKAMSEGQVFGLQMGSSTYQMTVKSIQDGQVVLVRGRDQEIIVPLRRR